MQCLCAHQPRRLDVPTATSRAPPLPQGVASAPTRRCCAGLAIEDKPSPTKASHTPSITTMGYPKKPVCAFRNQLSPQSGHGQRVGELTVANRVIA